MMLRHDVANKIGMIGHQPGPALVLYASNETLGRTKDSPAVYLPNECPSMDQPYPGGSVFPLIVQQ